MHRTVISISGGSGSGKSSLAKCLVERLGEDRAVRIPTDYFLIPRCQDTDGSFSERPLQYDWDLLERALKQPDGCCLTTPDFDFEHFLRRAVSGGRRYVLRPLVILDGMRLYPQADVLVFLDTPEEERRQRIASRDQIWNTNVLSLWNQHQITLEDVRRMQYYYDIQLDGRASPADNAVKILKILEPMGA